ncbi:outer membrane receptor for ferrienterochelin and colicins [Nostoc sp. PCC 7524]|uniref:TonB-dependent receptor domain-containing protein n=1 Tax=Nostoc sp. (strain ATCC 29411 / PCC 7524) TaxID=28072 RepID=UPI00029F0830|nr:TonB-dependent receptor [Nostoc sp. PCC 7524]AFY50228.1 outer membrane receptor for ferrienterochelin and colicins [Nostoc sp. PCC 7524]
MQRLTTFSNLAIASTILFINQPAWANINQITNVVVYETDDGIELSLESNNGMSSVSTSTEDKNFIADIANTQLRLQSGGDFTIQNPAPGITQITVTSPDANSVRVIVTGESAPPVVKVEQKDQEFLLFIATTAASTTTGEAPPTETPETTDSKSPPDTDIELVITANRRSTPLENTPATVEIKTREELQREQPLNRTVGEALQTLPGIVINRLGLLSGSANIRGLTGERIGVLVDGERLPNLEFGPDLGSVDPFRVQRLEVLKGPASSIYGADAFGGVINIITTTPQPDAPLQARAYVYGGGFAEYGGNLEITGPNFVIGTSRRVAGDATDAAGNLIPPQGTAYEIFDIYGTGRIDLDANQRLELRFDRYRQDNADLNGFPSPPFIAAKNVFRDRDRYSLSYINENKDGGTSFNLRSYYQKSARRFDNATQVTVSIPPTFRPQTITTPSSTFTLTESYGFSGSADTPLGNAGNLIYGIDISQDNSISDNLINNTTGSLGTRNFYGAFVQSTYDLARNFTLAGGLRYDIFNFKESTGAENNTNAVTFNIGSIYRITNTLAARVNFAQGFRPPRLVDLFGSDNDRTFFAPTRGRVLADPNIKPERANNFDIGLNYSSNTFRAGVTYFRNDISDFIGFESITPPPPPRFGAPAASIRVANKDVLLQGIEFSASYLLTRNLTVEGNLTYVNGEDKSGTPLSQLEVSPLTALIRLLYDNNQFSGYLQSRFYGGQGTVLLSDNRVGNGSPAATVFDLAIGYKVTPSTQLTLSVENLFNAEYIYPTVNFPAPGTRVLAGIRADF